MYHLMQQPDGMFLVKLKHGVYVRITIFLKMYMWIEAKVIYELQIFKNAKIGNGAQGLDCVNNWYYLLFQI